MGLFDFFKSKTPEEKKLEKFLKIRENSKIKEKKSLMQPIIAMAPHDDSLKDENPKGTGEFGLEKTNPVPVYGIDNVPAYMDKLRYEYTSKSGSGTKTYNPVIYVRTSDSDTSAIGSNKPETDPVASSTTSPNISGNIDVYNLYSMGGKKLAKIYVNSYSLRVSDKVPKGFFHRDDTPPMQDAKVLTEFLKNR